MAKTNPIGVRFNLDTLDYVKKEHGIESPQKALTFYERFFTAHHKLAKDITGSLRDEKVFPKSDDQIKTEAAEKARKIQEKASVVVQKIKPGTPLMPKGLSLSEQIEWRANNP